MQFDPQFESNLTYMGSVAALSLLLFGLAYNWLTAWLEQTGRNKGYTAFLVVVGTLVTVLATIPLIGFTNALVVLGAFVFSGSPMILGSIWRYMNERAEEEGGTVLDAASTIVRDAWTVGIEEDMRHG